MSAKPNHEELDLEASSQNADTRANRLNISQVLSLCAIISELFVF